MTQDQLLVPRCWALVRQDPWLALVLLWAHLRKQGTLEESLQRERCENEAKAASRVLFDDQSDLPNVHPVAALRAIDEYLSALEAAYGYVVPVRQVEIPGQAGGSYFVVPRRPGWTSDFAADQAGHLQYWMRRHQVVPRDHMGISIEILRPPDRLLNLFRRPRISFASGGFLDGVSPDWSPSSPHRCHRLNNSLQRWESVEGLLTDAQNNGTGIVVLPELTVDEDVRERIRAWLRAQSRTPLALVVAGSFHEDESGSPKGDGPRRNVARVFDGFGSEILKHIKLRPMRAKSEGSVKDEDIEGGSQVRLIQTGFGLIAVAICLDYFETGDVPVAGLWTTVGPALVLVPSMGERSTNRGHSRRAKDLARQHGTATIVASQHPESRKAWGLFWDSEGAASAAIPILHGFLEWTGE